MVQLIAQKNMVQLKEVCLCSFYKKIQLVGIRGTRFCTSLVILAYVTS
jgi:hypothetical protein